MKGVIAITTLEQIIAGQARENIVTDQAPDCVIQDGADQGWVVARCALQQHTAQARFHRDVLIAEPQHAHIAHHIHPIGNATAVVVEGEAEGIPYYGILRTAAGVNRDIRAIATIDCVVASAGGDGVVTAAGSDAVIAGAADDRVIPVAAIDAVVTSLSVQAVVTAAAEDGFVVAAAIDRVVAGAAIQHRSMGI